MKKETKEKWIEALKSDPGYKVTKGGSGMTEEEEAAHNRYTKTKEYAEDSERAEAAAASVYEEAMAERKEKTLSFAEIAKKIEETDFGEEEAKKAYTMMGAIFGMYERDGGSIDPGIQCNIFEESPHRKERLLKLARYLMEDKKGLFDINEEKPDEPTIVG